MMGAFYPKRTCSYQQHSDRIETMILEGLHDGKAWKPESHARYAELEAHDFLPRPAVPPEPTIAELKARIAELELELNHHIDSPDPSAMRRWSTQRRKDWYKLRFRKFKREIERIIPIMQGLKEEFNCDNGEGLLMAVRETLDGLRKRAEIAEDKLQTAGVGTQEKP